MLLANNIVPRSSEPLEPQESALDAATPPTSETSSGKRKHFKVEKDVESGLESDDEEGIREKALLVCFTFHVVNYWQFFVVRLISRDARRKLRDTKLRLRGSERVWRTANLNVRRTSWRWNINLSLYQVKLLNWHDNSCSLSDPLHTCRYLFAHFCFRVFLCNLVFALKCIHSASRNLIAVFLLPVLISKCQDMSEPKN